MTRRPDLCTIREGVWMRLPRRPPRSKLRDNPQMWSHYRQLSNLWRTTSGKDWP